MDMSLIEGIKEIVYKEAELKLAKIDYTEAELKLLDTSAKYEFTMPTSINELCKIGEMFIDATGFFTRDVLSRKSLIVELRNKGVQLTSIELFSNLKFLNNAKMV